MYIYLVVSCYQTVVVDFERLFNKINFLTYILYVQYSTCHYTTLFALAQFMERIII
jgi:hypothetical protein